MKSKLSIEQIKTNLAAFNEKQGKENEIEIEIKFGWYLVNVGKNYCIIKPRAAYYHLVNEAAEKIDFTEFEFNGLKFWRAGKSEENQLLICAGFKNATNEKNIKVDPISQLRAGKHTIEIYKLIKELKAAGKIINVTLAPGKNETECNIENAFGGNYKFILCNAPFGEMIKSELQIYCELLEIETPVENEVENVIEEKPAKKEKKQNPARSTPLMPRMVTPGNLPDNLPSVTHAKLHTFNKFNVGDFARVIYNETGHEFTPGEVVEIKAIESGHFVCENVRGEFWYIEGYELQPVESQKMAV